jgi:NAD(P)-dependent dehydrogenase (short-subunit alcohol dehydrogenase family)
MTNVIITGSSKGIGRGLAAEFASRGANVVVSGRSQAGIDSAIAAIGEQPGRLVGQPCDVSDYEQVDGLYRSAIDAFGSVDIWINNAGLARTVWQITDTPVDQVEAMIHTNMRGTMFGSIVAARGMRVQGGGKIFNILGGGSDGEYFPGIGVYGSTKRGLDYFSRALAKELADTKVIVGRVRPGMIVTDAVVREARENIDNFEKSRRMVNNLVDRIETVAPFLVDRMLAFDKSGGRIRWLTGGKIALRMLSGMLRPRPDQFADFGL